MASAAHDAMVKVADFNSKWSKFGHCSLISWKQWKAEHGQEDATDAEQRESIGCDKSIDDHQLLFDYDYCLDNAVNSSTGDGFYQAFQELSLPLASSYQIDGSGGGLVYGCEVFREMWHLERVESVEVVEPRVTPKLVLHCTDYEHNLHDLFGEMTAFALPDVMWFVKEQSGQPGGYPVDTEEFVKEWWGLGSEFECERGLNATVVIDSGYVTITIE